MNRVSNKQAACTVLMEAAQRDRDIIVLCSDSRGSASMAPFAERFPQQFVETGIAEQNLVSIAAGLARCGKKCYVVSPASFLTSRSYEQCKVDVAYSNTNVKLIGISGGVSYGALGMTHHSTQDVAALASIPNMRVYIPSDRFQTAQLMEALLQDEKPAYVRLGRSAVSDVYSEERIPFRMDQASVLSEGGDAAIISCGEMVRSSLDAAALLKQRGVSVTVVDSYCLKPLDRETICRAAGRSRVVVTVEEHAAYGGLGAMVSQAVGECCQKKVVNLALPDEPVISGTSLEVFQHYGLTAEGIAETVAKQL